MNEVQQPVRRRRRRRRRKNYRPLILLAAAVLLAVALIILLIWGVGLMLKGDEPEQTEPQQTQQTLPSEEPTTGPTLPEPTETEPPDTSPEGIIQEFAAQHGLSLSDYPDKLIELLGRNPEAEEFVLNYPLEYGKDHEIDISGYADYEGVPLFIQWDKQWGYIDYVGNLAGLSACGPTCLSMVTYYFTRDPAMTPAYMMEFSEANGYGKAGSGTFWSLFGQGAAKLGLTVKELTAEQIASEEKIAKVLDSGKLIVMNVSPGVFTEVGHYLLIVGYEDGKFRVNDPNSYANSEKLWEFEEFSDQIKMMWSFSD